MKSSFKSKEGYNGMCTVYVWPILTQNILGLKLKKNHKIAVLFIFILTAKSAQKQKGIPFI